MDRLLKRAYHFCVYIPYILPKYTKNQFLQLALHSFKFKAYRFIKEHLCYNEIANNVRRRDKMDLLTEEEIQKTLTELPKWERVDEKWLKREFDFNKYLSGIAFVQEVAEYAQEKRHHPIITIDHTTVMLKISSIEKDGLTDLDLEMVKEFSKLYEKADK